MILASLTAPEARDDLTGWRGRILVADLSARTLSLLHPDRETLVRFIGGKGLAGHLLAPFMHLPPGHPDLPVVLMTGPLVGTIAPTSGRGVLASRSPLTGTVGDSSFGGGLPTRLKRAGLDGVLVTGASDTLAGIEIEDRELRLVDAEHLRGQGTQAVFDAVCGGDASVSAACIGPAGENGSLLACVMVDRHHAAGRGGLGAVLGAKGLKYVRVSGSGRVPVSDKSALKRAREDIVRLTMASPALMGQQGFACFGTGAVFDLMDQRRMMPTDNFRATRFAGARSLGAFAFRERYRPERHGCKGCHILCKKVRRDTAGEARAMPEFETMSHFTALLGNTDMQLVVAANDLLNDLGLDTISAGATIACLREAEGLGALSQERVSTLIREMAQGPHGLGAGSRRWAEARGRSELSMSVKGQELSAYDPRGAYGMALAYATSTRGGCHLRAYPISHEILRKPVATDRFSFSGKARMVKIAEDTNAVVDSLTACKFIFFAAGLTEYARAYGAVTGERATGHDLLRAGERICCQDRLMNERAGVAAQDDLPERFFTEPGSSGDGIEVAPIDREEFLEARARYYRIRGLDEQGRTVPEKLRELEIEP